MIIKNVILENFRGIESLFLDLDRTTVLIGENNAGKTTVLEAIQSCLGRSTTRRLSPFEEFDYYLTDASRDPAASPAIRITLTFVEENEGEWPDEVLQAFPKAVQMRDDGRQQIRLRVTSAYDQAAKDFVCSHEFLNLADMPFGPNPRATWALNQLVPVFYLQAIRDAAQQFQARSAFWKPFARNLQLDNDKRQELEQEIEKINQSILDAHKPFDDVKKSIAKVAGLVPLAAQDQASIEAIPLRVVDMLTRAQVKLAALTGAKLPVERHGAGAQSLAVLFLFEAFLEAKLAETYDEYAEPLLLMEEPESHLHPSAVRALWGVLDSLKGQKLIATHSGDFLAYTPLHAIRRLARKDGKLHAFSISPGLLTEIEEQRVRYHIRLKRGSLLFARCWVLVEGESEFWFLPEAANIMGCDFDREGIACVEYAQCGPSPLIKLACALGIEWCLLADGDKQGDDNVKTAKTFLEDGEEESSRISQLPDKDLEHCLWKKGLDEVYESSVPDPSRRQFKIAKGETGYESQVIRAAAGKNGKPHLALASIEFLRRNGGADKIPETINELIQNALRLADKTNGA